LALLVAPMFAFAAVARAQTPPARSGSSTDMGTPSGNMNEIRDRSAVTPTPDVVPPPAAPATTMPPPPPAGADSVELEAPSTTTTTAPPAPVAPPQNPADVPDVSSA